MPCWLLEMHAGMGVTMAPLCLQNGTSPWGGRHSTVEGRRVFFLLTAEMGLIKASHGVS